MKETVLIGLMLCIFSVSLAQTRGKAEAKARITGTVVDSSSNLPLEYATVTVIKHGEKNASNGATLDNRGNFTVTNVPPALSPSL